MIFNIKTIGFAEALPKSSICCISKAKKVKKCIPLRKTGNSYMMFILNLTKIEVDDAHALFVIYGIRVMFQVIRTII